MMEDLKNWGLSEYGEKEASQYKDLLLARVTDQNRNLYRVISEKGFMQACVSGKFMHEAGDNSQFPTVGDWVMIKVQEGSGVIQHVLKRKSIFIRKAAGTGHNTQIVAANVEIVFICLALDSDYNIRRLERYLAIGWDSGATPVIILTKSDLCSNLGDRLKEVSAVSFGTDVIVCSSRDDVGYETVRNCIKHGKTVAFIGSSGVGKSTLINRLIGFDMSKETVESPEIGGGNPIDTGNFPLENCNIQRSLKTNDVRKDGKGRHTTTGRQLILLPNGGLVIDTPGMRELGAVSADFEKSFGDIDDLISKCRYSDCSHTTEPGCAVQAAISHNLLDKARFENYKKLRAEAEYNGLSSRQIEEEKIKKMFGGKREMKQALQAIKNKNKQW